MTRTAFLILCHRPPHHIATLAARHPDACYYIHYDAKSPLSALSGSLKNQPNIRILSHRIPVNWGGFTMIEAELALIQTALAHPANQHFHLISGDCAPLVSPAELARQCRVQPDNTLWLESRPTPHLRYRTRFPAPHADTAWQRSLPGKLLTKTLQAADKILPSRQTCLSGSQWFSANRTALQLLFAESLGEAAARFEKRLVPDEHFFQYIAAKHASQLNHLPNNHRFIRFSPNANHPDTLTLDDLWTAQRQGAWFARKVPPESMARWLQYESNV